MKILIVWLFLVEEKEIHTYTKPVSTPRIQDHILYVSNEDDGTDSYEDRVCQMEVFENSFCLKEFLNEYGIYPVDTVYIDGTEGVVWEVKT